MKRLEVDLLLQDLENTNIQIEKKLKKLDIIILYYMEENIDTLQPKEEKNNQINDDDNIDVENTENNSEDNKGTEIPESDVTDERKNQTKESEVEDLPHREKSDNLPPEIKTLYRKIMIKTHPDKNRNSNSEEYDALYKKAVKAKDDNDKATILLVAYELELNDLYHIDDKHFGSIKKQIAVLEKKKSTLDNNPFWIWYHSDNKNLKRVMIDQITRMRAK